MQLAQLLKPGTTEEMLPSMVECRVAGIRRTLLICGFEQVLSGRKSVDRFRQTWVCANAPIAHQVGRAAGGIRAPASQHRIRPRTTTARERLCRSFCSSALGVGDREPGSGPVLDILLNLNLTG